MPLMPLRTAAESNTAVTHFPTLGFVPEIGGKSSSLIL
jgi:hypothetical protein